MKLADLVDLEWLLRPDAEEQASDPQRDRAIGRRVCDRLDVDPNAARARADADRGFRAALCLAWLSAVRSSRPELPGQRIAHALRVVGWILIAIGALLGLGATKAFLAYDGSTPVNVLYFAAFFFGLQILLVLAMAWFALRAGRGTGGGGPGVLHQPIAFLAARLLGGRGRETVAALRNLQARAALHRDVERWTLFALAQRFGVAFNVAALAVTLLVVATTDLAFSWSTTLDLGPDDVHATVNALAFPWSFWEGAVPSQRVVEASQWDRMQRTFVEGGALEEAIPLAKQWWRFLVAGLVAWGLLPRLLALVLGSLRAARARAAAGLDHAGFQGLYERMLPPAVGWDGPAPEAVRGAAPAEGARQISPPPSAAGAPTWVVAWGSLAREREHVASQLALRFGAELVDSYAAGGAELDGDADTVKALRRAKATRVVAAFPAGLQPTAEVLAFLREVRAAVGAGKPLVAILVEIGEDGSLTEAADDERASWERSLAAADDPHLWLATVETEW